MKIKILDCTLRDGGYYNGWDFDHELISAYFKAMAALPVDMVEVGFRTMPGTTGKFKGGCAYCTDDFIRSLDLPGNGLRLAVMVNGADLLKYPGGVEAAVDSLFGPATESPVEMVRIACHVNQVEETLPAISQLNKLGYTTTINLMQIAGLPTEDIAHLSRVCSEYPIDVLYFADSLGSMVPDDIDGVVASLRTHWRGELGFHAHNNMEWALANSLRAMELGVTWIDSTVLGMGRGPGNARTEYLAIELESRLGRKVNHIPLLDLIDKYFRPMQQKYGWGPNPYYYISGKHGIHPTYAQTMLADNRYESDEILTVLSEISKIGGKSFTPDSLELAKQFYTNLPSGKWNPEDLLKNRTLLVLGSGPSIGKYSKAIKNYIEKHNPVVIALNKQSPIEQNLITARAACRPLRLLADFHDHICFPQPLISPVSMLPEEIRNIFADKETFDYGTLVKDNTFEIHDNYCVLPFSLVFAYVLAVGIRGFVSKILLAGFDGYLPNDPRTQEMDIILDLYFDHHKSVPIFAVTPTTYNVKQDSIYNPCL